MLPEQTVKFPERSFFAPRKDCLVPPPELLSPERTYHACPKGIVLLMFTKISALRKNKSSKFIVTSTIQHMLVFLEERDIMNCKTVSVLPITSIAFSIFPPVMDGMHFETPSIIFAHTALCHL